MGEALTFKFWIVILVTSKLHSRWRFYNGLCVAAQKYVDFTAVSGSELLAGNNNFTVFTISNENTEKETHFYFKNNSRALFSYLDKKSIFFLDEWKNLPVDLLVDVNLKFYVIILIYWNWNLLKYWNVLMDKWIPSWCLEKTCLFNVHEIFRVTGLT